MIAQLEAGPTVEGTTGHFATLGRRLAPASLPARGKTRVAKQSSNGGGGGHTALVLGLVGTAAGLGATYYLVKESQKQTSDLIGQVTPH